MLGFDVHVQGFVKISADNKDSPAMSTFSKKLQKFNGAKQMRKKHLSWETITSFYLPSFTLYHVYGFYTFICFCLNEPNLFKRQARISKPTKQFVIIVNRPITINPFDDTAKLAKLFVESGFFIVDHIHLCFPSLLQPL